MCVRQNAAQQAFLATFYPQLKVQPVPGLTQAGLLPAIASGICKGGVGPDPELKYSLGGPGIFDSDGFDPTRAYLLRAACMRVPRSVSHARSRSVVLQPRDCGAAAHLWLLRGAFAHVCWPHAHAMC